MRRKEHLVRATHATHSGRRHTLAEEVPAVRVELGPLAHASHAPEVVVVVLVVVIIVVVAVAVAVLGQSATDVAVLAVDLVDGGA